jgi:fido (protein-threonine AMPylation protein)
MDPVEYHKIIEAQNRSEDLISFVFESNKIENILRDPTKEEIKVSEEFLSLDKIHVSDVCKLVDVYQPGAKLRDKKGMDVRVGNHIAPFGEETIRRTLEFILNDANALKTENQTHLTHLRYENLHPFMDGNGRSGRMIWLWQMRRLNKTPASFLQWWYYQSLSYFHSSP